MRTRMLAFLLLVAAGAMAGDRFQYLYKRGDSTNLHMSGDLDTALRVSKKYSGHFIWARQDGREYLIRDANILGQIDAALAVLAEFEPNVRAAERKVKPFERQMDDIEERADKLSDQLGDEDLSDAQRDAIEAKLHEVEAQMHEVEQRMREVEDQLEAVERQMDAREEEVDRKVEALIRKAIRNGLGVRAD